MSKCSGIYKIQSICKPERVYIGSAVNIDRRWRAHLKDLKEHRHHSVKLQRHYDKYGVSDLVFNIITCCNKEELISIEQLYIDALNPCFNICRTAGSTLGVKYSIETKQKVSKALTGRPCSEETRRKIGKAHKGKIISEKQREQIREKLKGIKPVTAGMPLSEETRRKISIARKGKPSPLRGRHLSVDHIHKLVESHLGNEGYWTGKHLPDEMKAKLRAAKIGKKLPEEQKRKMAEAQKKRWAIRKQKNVA